MEAAIAVAPQPPPALVDLVVVERTQKGKVAQQRLAPALPGHKVVGLAPRRWCGAAGEHAAAIAALECSPLTARRIAKEVGDPKRLDLTVNADAHEEGLDTSVAQQTVDRPTVDWRAIVEPALARREVIEPTDRLPRQRASIDGDADRRSWVTVLGGAAHSAAADDLQVSDRPPPRRRQPIVSVEDAAPEHLIDLGRDGPFEFGSGHGVEVQIAEPSIIQ